MIKIQNLCKSYKKKEVLDNLNLEIEQGEICALLGQNGAGKTTTIKILSGLLEKNSGKVTIGGYDLDSQLADIKKLINVSPQETAVAERLTVAENMVFISMIYGMSKKEAKEATNRMLKDFDLEKKRNEKAKTLSGGMQRKLSIALALISEPKVLFLDEPTLGLDIISRRELWKVIRQLKGKITIILTTHYLEEAESLADHIAIMEKGKVKLYGTFDEIKKETGCDSLEEAFLQVTEGGSIDE